MVYGRNPGFGGFYSVSISAPNSCPIPITNLFFQAAPLETIGLFGFAWTSLGPPKVHWVAPMVFSTLIAIANVSWSSTE